MLRDLRTVMWKEWRSLVHQPGGRLRMLITVSVPILYFGVVGPLQAGARFVDDADPWLVVVVLPVLAVVVTAPDSFAGERERKTLRTLLAGRGSTYRGDIPPARHANRSVHAPGRAGGDGGVRPVRCSGRLPPPTTYRVLRATVEFVRSGPHTRWSPLTAA